MGQTFLSGRNGNVRGATTSTAHSEMKCALAVWTGNFPMQIFDITAFGNVGWRQKLGGLFDSNGSAGGFATKGTSADTMAAITGRSQVGVALILGFDGGASVPTCYLSSCALLSNIRTGADVNDVIRVTFDWELTALSISDALTPAAPVVTWVVT